MPSGILGQSNPAAATNTTVYTVPASIVTTATVSICNTGISVARVRIALSGTGTPDASEWIEYDAEVSASGVLERTGIVLNAAERVVVFSDSAALAVSVYGFEE